MKIKLNHLNKLFLVAALIAVLLGLLMFTDPNRVPLTVLVAPFICIGLIIYHLSMLLMGALRSDTSRNAARMFCGSLAFLGVALLLLRSLHQLTLKDAFLVCGFTLAFWLYIWRADFLHK